MIMKKKWIARILAGTIVILFGMSVFAYGLTLVSQPTFVFPWGASTLVFGLGIIIGGVAVLFGKLRISDVLEDIF